MDNEQLTNRIDALIDKWGQEHIMNYSENQRNATLGTMISGYCNWNSYSIMEIFAEALEDANFHDECAQVRKWMESDD